MEFEFAEFILSRSKDVKVREGMARLGQYKFAMLLTFLAPFSVLGAYVQFYDNNIPLTVMYLIGTPVVSLLAFATWRDLLQGNSNCASSEHQADKVSQTQPDTKIPPPAPADPSASSTAEKADDATLWVVCRQDDNGNKFEVSRGHSRPEADALVDHFEATGHKQTYWVEPQE